MMPMTSIYDDDSTWIDRHATTIVVVLVTLLGGCAAFALYQRLLTQIAGAL